MVNFVKLEAVHGPVLVNFGPLSQPLWAPRRLIFAKFAHFWGGQDARFWSNLESKPRPSWLTQAGKNGQLCQIGGGRWAHFG